MTNLVTAANYPSLDIPDEDLRDASSVVLNWTDRDFGAATVTEDRTYKYDGRGFLEIDDCTDIHTVNGLGITYFRAGSDGPVAAADIFSYLELPRVDLRQWTTSIGQMGFTRNLDRILASGTFPTWIDITVNADFGWPVVPDDVQRAVIITARSMGSVTADEGGQELAGKTVAEVSEQFQLAQPTPEGPSYDPLPDAALKILWPYKRHSL